MRSEQYRLTVCKLIYLLIQKTIQARVVNHNFPELLLLLMEYWLVAFAAACWPFELDLLLELREARD